MTCFVKGINSLQGGTFKITAKDTVWATVEAISVDGQGVETCAPLTEEAFGGQLVQSGSGWMEVLNKAVLLGMFIRLSRITNAGILQETKCYKSFRESFPALSDVSLLPSITVGTQFMTVVCLQVESQAMNDFRKFTFGQVHMHGM